MAEAPFRYEVHGQSVQALEVELQPHDSLLAQPGAMVMMDRDIEMDLLLGKEQDEKLRHKMLSASKQWVSGERLSRARFTNHAASARRVYFSHNPPGRIVGIHVPTVGGHIICRQGAFLCGPADAVITVSVRKKLGVGVLGGSGFLMQKITSEGTIFLHAGGSLLQRELAEGEELRVDTGSLLAFTPQISYEIKYVGSIRRVLFAGEGICFARLSGPGSVWVQTEKTAEGRSAVGHIVGLVGL